MRQVDPKHKVAILRAMQETGTLCGSAEISRTIRGFGVELSDRTVRWYLEQMEKEGLVTASRRGRSGGRTITPQGMEEIEDALVVHRIGLTAARVDTFAWQMTFDLRSRTGLVVLNITIVDATSARRAFREMVPVFKAGLGMGVYATTAREGEQIGHFVVPKGKIAIGSVCSVTVNGVLLKAGIPTTSRFGGVLELHDRKPFRFTDMIHYEGTSLDPLEIFIKGGLTSVRRATLTGNGRIGAGFREVPTAALGDLERVRSMLEEAGLGGIMMIGKPNQPLLDIPVPDGRTGVIVAGGLNPASAVEEAGIPTTNHALSCLYEFGNLTHYSELSSMMRGD